MKERLDPGSDGERDWYSGATHDGSAVADSREDRLAGVAEICRRVLRRREQLGLRQLELATRAGMSEAYINRLENGVVRNPKIRDLALVASALAVPLESLLAAQPARTDQETLTLLARRPRLAAAVASLVRGLEWADPEDCEFVLGHLESLAARFGDRTVPNRA